jgi:RNA polymerase sigma-70 factor (ECF subfamily)
VDFKALFDGIYPSLFRYCQRHTGDPDVSDDVAQEAFVRLLEREVEGDPDQLKVWLFQVATHLLRDRFRMQQTRGRLRSAMIDPRGEAPRPDRDLERAERVRIVRAGLAELDERGRELLLMREEGFSYKEMAEVVDVAVGSVGTLLARAEQALIDELERREYFDESP